jgi:hypothetical protein
MRALASSTSRRQSLPQRARLAPANSTTDRSHRGRPSLNTRPPITTHSLLTQPADPARARSLLIGQIQMPQDGVDLLGIHQHADQRERSTAARPQQRTSRHKGSPLRSGCGLEVTRRIPDRVAAPSSTEAARCLACGGPTGSLVGGVIRPSPSTIHFSVSHPDPESCSAWGGGAPSTRELACPPQAKHGASPRTRVVVSSHQLGSS